MNVKPADRRALITGGSGQDADYLARLLCGNGYELHIQSRSPPPDSSTAPSGTIPG